MSLDELSGFIYDMQMSKYEDDLWAVWLANPFKDTSFEEFKSQVSEKSKTKEEAEAEALAGEADALFALNARGGGKNGS